ncbi:hypothetical protein VTH82DRAFT_3999 [Thermothelomyces myriococcoides]
MPQHVLIYETRSADIKLTLDRIFKEDSRTRVEAAKMAARERAATSGRKPATLIDRGMGILSEPLVS